MPDADTNMRGFALNCRFAENGIQKAFKSEGPLVLMNDTYVFYILNSNGEFMSTK